MPRSWPHCLAGGFGDGCVRVNALLAVARAGEGPVQNPGAENERCYSIDSYLRPTAGRKTSFRADPSGKSYRTVPGRICRVTGSM